MYDYLRHFESLGSNCEFGFFLKNSLHPDGTALRWAEIERIESLIGAIDNNFEGLFAFDNLVPFNQGMVLDQASGIAWHSPMHSQTKDPGSKSRDRFQFVAPEAERRELWRAQLEKMSYMIEKTRTRIAANARIYVYKPHHSMRNFSERDAIALSDALAARGARKLMVVTLADETHHAGDIAIVRPGLVHGHLDRFAPGHDAGNVSQQVWTQITRKALAELR